MENCLEWQVSASFFICFKVYSLRESKRRGKHVEDFNEIILAIHGGAGTLFKGQLSPEREAGARAGLDAALQAGYRLWQAGADCLEIVVAAVQILEDCEYFNAGKGSVFSHEGRIEMDAAVMRGQDAQAGAVAGVSGVKNPVLLARKVLEASPHVLLIGAGAEAFAREQGLEFAPPEYFFTDYRWQQLLKLRDGQVTALEQALGTVGAVARDHRNHLAAATSTGGMTNKRFGRVGDSPLIGAGTFADDRSCAVSATGHGEFLIRTVIGHSLSAWMRMGGLDLPQAAAACMAELEALGGEGGLIALDTSGRCVMPFNTGRMYRGCLRRDGTSQIQIYA